MAWRRSLFGWLSPDGAWFMERGAPMSDGGTAWLVWRRAGEDEYEEDEFGAHCTSPPYTDPIRTLDALANLPGGWFRHVGDAGSLAEAKGWAV